MGGVPHRPSFPQIFRTLLAQYGDGFWKWQDADPFEIVVGAVLVQNTTWVNASTSIEHLRERGLLDPARIAAVPVGELQQIIRPSGFMTAKAGTLHTMAAWVSENSAGDGAAAELSTAKLRRELLSLRGIGPETADVLCLNIFHRPVFIFDAYGRRMLDALGWEPGATYEQARRRLQHHAVWHGVSAREMQDFHSLVLMAGKDARKAGGWIVFARQLPWGEDRGVPR